MGVSYDKGLYCVPTSLYIGWCVCICAWSVSEAMLENKILFISFDAQTYTHTYVHVHKTTKLTSTLKCIAFGSDIHTENVF